MTMMQAYLRTMTAHELKEFKRQITPDATQIFVTALKNKKTLAKSLSRETSPHANRMFAAELPSRETGPHPNKSVKKLAQALKKRAKYEAKQQTHTPGFNHSFEMLAQALRRTTKTPHPNLSMKTLPNALKQHAEEKDQGPIRTYAEQIRELIRSPERCEECGREHPTRFCMKCFEKFRKPETTPLPVTEDDSTNSDTLCDSEESEDNKTEPIADLTKGMKRLSLVPNKSVTFDLREDDPDALPHDTNDSTSDQSDNTEEPTSQSEEVDARLAHAAWLRKTSENVYMSNRKSMILKAYVHAAHRRTEAPTLLDSGATENFMSLTYAKWLKLPFKHLPYERPLLNIDGTTNKTGSLKYYTDLQVQTGTKCTDMRFLLTDLGDHKVILGYPWFAANQPKIDWARGWIDTTQLPLVLHSTNALKPQFDPNMNNLPDPTDDEILYVGRIHIEPRINRQTVSSTLAEEHNKPQLNPIPKEYRRHHKVFSEEATQRFPESHIWDHAIELKPGAPSTLPGKIYALSQLELQELAKFVKEHLAKGYIRPSKSPYAAPFFFIKKKDGKLRPVQDYRRLNEWTIHNRYPLPLIPQLINRIRMKKLFTKFDVHWGYNNVRIKKGDEWKATFITNEGLYEPTVMFFGMTNSPTTFQAMINTIFEDEIREGWLTVYMDDMLIATNDDPTLHTKYVHRILDKLEKHDLYLKPEKCVFAQRRIEFLGVVLEGNTIQMDPTKIRGVEEWPQPRNPTDVRSFLGFTGFYRYFIPNYSKVARPLLDLTKKATPWVWTEAQTTAFETLKKLMCSKPVLTQPQYNKPFIVHTDASCNALAGVKAKRWRRG